MSNSGEEDRLSSPTDASTEAGSKEAHVHISKQPNEDRINPKAKSSSKPNTYVKKPNSTMTQSNSSDHDILAEDSNNKVVPRRTMQITEENIFLKRQLKKQEERIKILATKLIRVISERSNKTKREEILLDEQKARIADLEHEVSNLRDKLQVTKQQLSSYTRLIPHHPLSRQASMLSSSTVTSHSKLIKKPRSAKSSGSQQPRPNTASSNRGNAIDKNFADRVEQLLLEAKAENQALEDQLKHCRQRLATTEEELERTKQAIKSNEMEHQEEIVSIKSQLDKEQGMVTKKKQLSDNIQLIRLQRESRRTASWLSTLEAQSRALEVSLASATETAQQLETQLVEVQEELGQEQQKNITLQKQMEDATSSLNCLKELEAQITALHEENTILQDTNESLLKKAFAVTEKVEKAESMEMSMKVQMTHLETVLKTEMRSKNDLQESFLREKEKSERLQATNERLQNLLDKLSDEMKKLSLTPQNDILEDFAVSRNSDDGGTGAAENEHAESKNCSSNNVNELKAELHNIKHELTVVKNEYHKVKLQLRSQVNANHEYQQQVEDLTFKLDKADEFHHKKLQDFVKVLEERTKQISFLEKYMDEWKIKQLENNVPNPICSACGDSLSDLNKIKITEPTPKVNDTEYGETQQVEQLNTQDQET